MRVMTLMKRFVEFQKFYSEISYIIYRSIILCNLKHRYALNLKNFGLYSFLGNCVEKKGRRKMLTIFFVIFCSDVCSKVINSELDECLSNWNDWGEESIRWLRTSLHRLPFFVYLFVSNQLDVFFSNKLYRNKFKTVFFQRWTGSFHRYRGE